MYVYLLDSDYYYFEELTSNCHINNISIYSFRRLSIVYSGWKFNISLHSFTHQELLTWGNLVKSYTVFSLSKMTMLTTGLLASIHLPSSWCVRLCVGGMLLRLKQLEYECALIQNRISSLEDNRFCILTPHHIKAVTHLVIRRSDVSVCISKCL